jgi:hypothetical protein
MGAKVVRETVTTPAPAPVAKVPEKTWDELTPEEREALMKRIAEERGYVKK